MGKMMQASNTMSTPLICGDRVVAEYVWNPLLSPESSPRPYLYPVTTLSGTRVVACRPDDHPHHLGASVAIAVLNGINYWGGRTYVCGHGSVPLNNHGTQRHLRWVSDDSPPIVEMLSWEDPHNHPVALEQRHIRAYPLRCCRGYGSESIDGWVLEWEFSLTAVTKSTIVIESPGSRGRHGAGYGGFFWRAPEDLEWVRTFNSQFSQASEIHGSRYPWVALTGCQRDGLPWTLVFIAGTDDGCAPDPWFVRASDYAGVCQALAWDQPLVIEPGETLSRKVRVVVADGILGLIDAEAIVATAMVEGRS